ncbi:MAG: hypothetical protein PF481_06090 [Bacteroidales bacterium]|jgi:hypothetical protein|nr:hypothetical protein [Bacteroidales bacterium]
MKYVTIKSYTYSHNAHLDEMRLKNEGIPVFLKDELTNQVDNFMSNAIGGVKLQVPEEYKQKAETILDIKSRPISEQEGLQTFSFLLQISRYIPFLRHVRKDYQIVSMLIISVVFVVFFVIFLYFLLQI